jgi:hypothetical protein
MDDKTGIFKDLVPLLGKLVWPLFILFILVLFRDEAGEVYKIAKQRFEGGASLKIGGIFELGQQAGATQIGKLSLNNLPIEAIGGAAGTIEKESLQQLENLREQFKNAPQRRIDTLRVSDSKRYSPALLKDYVTTLGIRYVVFERGGAFDGWIDSGVFLGQLSLLRPGASAEEQNRAILPYDELRSHLGGVSTQSADNADSARQVLGKMQELHLENLPILKDGRFIFFANRGEILSSLISKLIVEQGEK